ncbi:ribosome-associated heat shock protein Hsp15 [Litoribacillus peritrichatus]|uniref:Heat shock protein 15 n=1 Tax=Litoribacillus peritrichatus TaxID=718191 RepID=A0ABP7MQB7_9GAMM
MSDDQPLKVRLDKWLWAARLYKTRGLAKQFIEGGKVHYNSQRIKPSRTVEVGALITLRQGWDEKTIVVKGIAEKRVAAPQAQLLYEETPESIEKRTQDAITRKTMGAAAFISDTKPNKKERRQIHRFKNDVFE